jgi:hypothetical protein
MLEELRHLVAVDDDGGARAALLRAAAISHCEPPSSNGEGAEPSADRRGHSRVIP